MTAATGRARRVVPLVAIGVGSLVMALWAGVARLGFPLPIATHLPGAHGPLMVVGFLGTVISLERAVALSRAWGYVAPVGTAASAVLLLVNARSEAAALSVCASVAFLAMCVVFARKALAIYTVAAACAALAWCVGNLMWVSGAPLFRVVPWWETFLVVTIAAERLELTRVMRPSSFARATFVVVTLAIAAALVVGLDLPELGGRIRGAAMIALAVWLARFDVARRTVRQKGLPRFVAICLLAGYAWLAIGGALVVVHGDRAAGLEYDAALHALFVGVVVSMIFGHAPIVLPAIAGVPMPFRPRFYVHVALLHGALLARVVGDIAVIAPLRAYGGLFSAIAIVVFLVSTVAAVSRSRLSPSR